MMLTGEICRCTMPECGCEIQVTRGAKPGGGDNPPYCCCGQPMEKANLEAPTDAEEAYVS